MAACILASAHTHCSIRPTHSLKTWTDGGGILVFSFQQTYPPAIEQLLRQYYQSLSEKDRRRFAAVEAIKLGHGGIRYIAQVLGCDPHTVREGMRELKQLSHDTTGHVDQASDMSQASIRQELHELEHREIAYSSTLPLHQPLRRSIRVKEQDRIRRLGGGRKLTEEQNPTLVAALEQVLR